MFASHAAIFTGTSKGVVYKDANWSNSNTVTIPAHNAGDLIVVYAFGRQSLQAPSATGTIPTWSILLGQSSWGFYSMYAQTFYAVATSSSTTSGTWGGVSTLIAVVLSGQAAQPQGGSGNGNTSFDGGATSATVPAISTLTNTTGSSQILHFIGYNSATNYLSAVPAGYTKRIGSATQTYSGFFTKDSTTSDGAVQVTSNEWISGSAAMVSSIEILSA